MKAPPRLWITICLGWMLVSCSMVGKVVAPTDSVSVPSALPVIPKFTPTIEVTQPDPTRPVVEPTQSPTAPPRFPVVVIGWDGAQAGMVYNWMADGHMEHFTALANCGLRAEYVTSVDPTLSAPAQTSLVTGAYPSRTGIVSNAFHNPNDSFYWYRTAFEEPLDQARPLWVAASQAGLTTAALFISAASPAFPGQMADYTIGYGIRDALSSQVQVKLAPSPTAPASPLSYSPTLEGSFFIPQVARVDLLVIDASNDQQVNYDTVLLQSAAADSSLPLELAEWGSLVLLPNVTAGADFLVQEISPQQVTLFHSGVYHNTAAPRALLDEINQHFSFFAPPADEYALEHAWITEEDYLGMIERSARWRAQVTAWVYETIEPDLLFAWLDTLDAAGHIFLLVDPEQPGYSPERAEQSERNMQRAAGVADRALELILQPIDLTQTNVLLVADHGMAPLHTSVYINTLLEGAGLLKLDRRDYVDVKNSQALAVASGGSAHVYINLIGRERDGVVLPDDYPEIQAKIVDLFRTLVDPSTGQPVFQRVLARQELDGVGLAHPNAGDVFVQAVPGYNLDGWRGNKDVFTPVTFSGGHGFDSAETEMRAIFIACGASILTKASQPKGLVISPVQIVDIAPTIAALLRFDPGPVIDGVVIPGIAR